MREVNVMKKRIIIAVVIILFIIAGYLTIDGDSYMDHPGGYSEEGGILGTGGKSVPEY